MREKGRLRDDLGSWKIEIGNSKFGRGRWRGLGEEAIGAGAEESEEAKVAEDLELLADFVPHVGAAEMEGKGQNPQPLKRRLRYPGPARLWYRGVS